MPDQLIDAIANMREEEALNLVDEIIETLEDPNEILQDCKKGMNIVGERFEKGVYFLPELMMAGVMLSTIAEKVKPYLKTEVPSAKRGKVLVGTVAGDIHDIGKDIVVFMLDVSGFEVLDLGIDVPPDRFVEAIKDFRPTVVGLSGFLTAAFDAMKDTVDLIQNAGLRDQIKIMIGGGQIDDTVKNYIGADAFGKDASEAVKLAGQWIN